ncbi:YceD family protein [Pontibaca methylaminivorans]|uniref:Uncharacterized metal-binding protein YceD, DUF177 family n=1 Tax=Pontibaca methylaminivorans TaxID=515897 RepID=A0A1R3X393_9RHOB|nr:DUF177 domain-containing protein [Pontibaca methylaminivorans]SIT85206.1 Uncharacterized metal-binding protein YceD, DUF177 family [Pontibaca methylaminivorans]
MPANTALSVAALSGSAPTPFDLRPGAAELADLAERLDLLGLRKLRFSGTITAEGGRDWLLSGQLGATVVQRCVVTLAPVTTRIDVDVTRHYIAEMPEPEGDEVEMPDDTLEPLGSHIDPGAVMVEALSLSLPAYPRAQGAEMEQAVFAGPGITPLRDEDLKPLAGLAALRDMIRDPAKDGE